MYVKKTIFGSIMKPSTEELQNLNDNNNYTRRDKNGTKRNIDS